MIAVKICILKQSREKCAIVHVAFTPVGSRDAEVRTAFLDLCIPPNVLDLYMVLEYHEWRPGRAPNSDLCTRETDRGTMIPPMRSSAFSGVSPHRE